MKQSFAVPWTTDTHLPSKEQKMKGHLDVPARYAYVDGLIITRNVVGPSEWSDEWVLTHKASGRVLPGVVFPTVASARRAAKAIQLIADWTDPDLMWSITDQQKTEVIDALMAEAESAWERSS